MTIPTLASCVSPNVTLRYTMDGSRPTASSPEVPVAGVPIQWPGDTIVFNVKAFPVPGSDVLPSVTNGELSCSPTAPHTAVPVVFRQPNPPLVQLRIMQSSNALHASAVAHEADLLLNTYCVRNACAGVVIERYNYRPRAGFGPWPHDCELEQTVDSVSLNATTGAVAAAGWVVDGCSADHLGTPPASIQLRVDMRPDVTVVANNSRCVRVVAEILCVYVRVCVCVRACVCAWRQRKGS